MKKGHNLLNKKFAYLTIIQKCGRNKIGCILWKCKCVCGNEILQPSNNLISGRTVSCGCKRIKHGKCRTSSYKSWNDMKSRCLNKKHKSYNNYGGRGIKICDKWLKFENFYEDMGDRPRNMSLDRINNSGNYCKENCRWATAKEQANNTRSNHLVTCNGKIMNITQWAKELNVSRSTLYGHLFRT